MSALPPTSASEDSIAEFIRRNLPTAGSPVVDAFEYSSRKKDLVAAETADLLEGVDDERLAAALTQVGAEIGQNLVILVRFLP